MENGKEMSLEEWVGRLPDSHLAAREYAKLKAEIERKDRIFRMLLGHYDLPPHGESPGAYYWRTPLREKLSQIGFIPEDVHEAITEEDL